VAQSPEFPELKFVKPKSWKSGRARPGQPTIIVIHDTEGSEGRTAAENGAAYDARRTDGVSTHFFVDADSCVQCVLTKDTAHHAKSEGNIRGIGFELCGRASQTQAQWLDGGLDLRLAARYVAKCCRKWNIPARKLTVAQLRAGEKGICGHDDVSKAWHQTDHTDPGRNFPWSQFIDMVQAELNPPEEDDMPTAKEIAQAVWNTDNIVPAPWPVRTEDNEYWAPGTILHHGLGHAISHGPKIDALTAKVNALTNVLTALAEALKTGGGDIDTAAVLSRLDELTSQVANLGQRVLAAEAERDALRQRLAAAYASQGN
jgi:N-acetyl-anhydromuramyl-L-alanine amidase AmpD